MKFEELQATLQNLTNSKITYQEIADALGRKLSTISTRKGDGSELRLNELKKIESYFDVVLTDSACQTAKLIEEIEQNRNNVELATIEYYPDVYLSAGFGVEVLDESFEHVIIDERFLTSERGMRVNPKNCKMVRISGNSMFKPVAGAAQRSRPLVPGPANEEEQIEIVSSKDKRPLTFF